MKIRGRIVVVILIVTALILAVQPAAVFAYLRVNDIYVDVGKNSFQCLSDGELTIALVNNDGERMHFYGTESGSEFIADGARFKNEYMSEGKKDFGDSLSVSWRGYDNAEGIITVTYDRITFGFFEMTPKPAPGFIFQKFVDPTCSCYQPYEQVGGSYRATLDSVEAIAAFFVEDENWTNNSTAAPVASVQPVAPTLNIFLNGRAVETDASLFTENGRTMVPFRFINEALGAEVGWDNKNNQVTATSYNGVIIRLKIGETDMFVTKDGKQSVIHMDAAAMIKNDRTFIPVRYVAEALGLKIGWDQQTLTVLLTSGN